MMALGEKYSVFVDGQAGLSMPLQSTDEIAVVRSNNTYKVPGTAFTGAQIYRTLAEFGAVSDIQSFAGGATWAAGGTLFTPNNSITPADADIGKRLVVYGAGAGGTTYSGEIVGVSGISWEVSPALSQASGLAFVIAAVCQTPAGATGYVPGDTITLTGGDIAGGSQAVLRIKWTKINGTTLPTIVSAGSGGVDGPVKLTGTTGRGLYFILEGTIAGGVLTAITGVYQLQPNAPSATNARNMTGLYSVNPTNVNNEPVVPTTENGVLTNSLTGASVALKMIPAQVYLNGPGGYLTFPTNDVSQGSTSGAGTGMTFALTDDFPALTGHYGQWYFGTDDTAAVQAALTWAGSNNGAIQWTPKERCGISAELASTGNFATLTGTSYGFDPTILGATAYTEGIYWLGAAAPSTSMIKFSAPDGEAARVGNSVSRLALIGANLAGYGVRIFTQQSGFFDHLYTEGFATCAIETTTNTNADPPSDTQHVVFNELNMNQFGANGVMLRVTGDQAVAQGDSSLVRFYDTNGVVGFDTGYEIAVSDHAYWYGMRSFLHSFQGTRLHVDWGTAGNTNLSLTNGHRVRDYVGGYMLFRGTQSSGDAAEYANNIFIDDTQTANYSGPIFEPPGTRAAQIAYIHHSRYASRDFSDNIASELSLGDVGAPEMIASMATTAATTDIAIQDNYLYLASASGIQTVDVTDPSRPASISNFATLRPANGIVVSGQYAYVSEYDSGGAVATFEVVDISNPAVPASVGSVAMPASTGGRIFMLGTFAFVAGSELVVGRKAFTIIDASNPAAPAVTSATSPSTGYPKRIWANAKYALIQMDGDLNFYIYDVSNVAVPVLVSTTALAHNGKGDLAVAGRYAYLGTGLATMTVADLKDFTAPTIVVPASVMASPDSMVVAGKYLYVANEPEDRVHIYDISMPLYPQELGHTNTTAGPSALLMSGRYAFVGEDDPASGLEVFRASGLDVPTANIGAARIR